MSSLAWVGLIPLLLLLTRDRAPTRPPSGGEASRTRDPLHGCGRAGSGPVTHRPDRTRPLPQSGSGGWL